jgi:5-methyltetrahydrofolate--homocysteine methyltransferase
MDLEIIFKYVIQGQADEVENSVKDALDAGVEASIILNNVLIAAMNEVGYRFEKGDFYIPEMLIAARAMQAGLTLLKPYLVDTGVKAVGRVVIGTVAGDLHEIGKNLVGMMLEGAGFEVIDLGTDIEPEEFVNAVREHKPDIVAMSALLTTTMPNLQSTLKALEGAKLRKEVKVIIGGAPVTEEYANKIGADGYGRDASLAVKVARSSIGIP